MQRKDEAYRAVQGRPEPAGREGDAGLEDPVPCPDHGAYPDPRCQAPSASLEKSAEIERCARGLVRTSGVCGPSVHDLYQVTGDVTIVRTWWDALLKALAS